MTCQISAVSAVFVQDIMDPSFTAGIPRAPPVLKGVFERLYSDAIQRIQRRVICGMGNVGKSMGKSVGSGLDHVIYIYITIYIYMTISIYRYMIWMSPIGSRQLAQTPRKINRPERNRHVFVQ